MGTQVKTAEAEAPEIATSVSPALVKAAMATVVAQANAFLSLVTFALMVRKAFPKGKEDGAPTLKAALIHSANLQGKTEVEQEIFLGGKRIAPIVSRGIRLAYPVTPEASHELDLGLAYNAKQTNTFAMLDQETILGLARGNQTFAEAIAGKAVKASRKARTPGETKTLDKDSSKGLREGLTILLKGYVGKERLSIAQARAICADCLDKRETELKS